MTEHIWVCGYGHKWSSNTATSNWWFGPMIWSNNLRVSKHNLSYMYRCFYFSLSSFFPLKKRGKNTPQKKTLQFSCWKPSGFSTGNFWWLRTWFSSQNPQETPRLCVWKLCKRCANWRSGEMERRFGKVCEAYFCFGPYFFVFWSQCTLRSTNMAGWKMDRIEDVSPIEHGDIPACYVNLAEGMVGFGDIYWITWWKS